MKQTERTGKETDKIKELLTAYRALQERIDFC